MPKEERDLNYVIGIGIDNFGFHPTYGAIIKNKEYYLPKDFDFKNSVLFKKKIEKQIKNDEK